MHVYDDFVGYSLQTVAHQGPCILRLNFSVAQPVVILNWTAHCSLGTFVNFAINENCTDRA